jgi:HAMP domain-containing protein
MTICDRFRRLESVAALSGDRAGQVGVSAMADAVSLGTEHVEAYIKPGKDEISSLAVSFNRMRESLKHAMEMIK